MSDAVEYLKTNKNPVWELDVRWACNRYSYDVVLRAGFISDIPRIVQALNLKIRIL